MKHENHTYHLLPSHSVRFTLLIFLLCARFACPPKILLTGMIQSLYEAAMYIFVLQWAPSLSSAISSAFSPATPTPYGIIFSCFMASCLFGSTVFSSLIGKVPAPRLSALLTGLAAVSMAVASYCSSLSAPPLLLLTAAFFAFEATVGCYFPTVGTLRSKYVPDSHRSVIMNLFGVPLNLLVVGVFLSINSLGVAGALGVSSAALALATAAGFELDRIVAADEK